MTGTILDACQDPTIFGPWFRDRETWRAWFSFLKALFGLPMDADELAIFRSSTGLDEPPAALKEAWLICGRRAGKSRMLALIAVFLASYIDWAPYLSPGERGTVMVVATDRRQARVIFRYVMAFLTGVPSLKSQLERETADLVDLKNGVTIEILTASFRTVRGYTLLAALLDEIAFWRSDESANPDEEILNAIRPAMATIPGSMLLAASSPYARRGVMYKTFRRSYGKSGPTLVWKADTRTMNPTVPPEVITEAYEEDPASAAAEYGAEFRSDVETFVSREVVDAAVVPGRHELPPVAGISYAAFVDPSGGSADSMTLAVAHRDRPTNRAVLDAVREVKPPFSPDSVVEDFAALLKTYRLRSVTGDRYAGEWPRERFRVHGIVYQPSEKAKSDLYRDLLPVLNSGGVELLDLPKLTAQLCALERRTARGGRDSIDHPPGAHDDTANAVAGAVVAVSGRQQQVMTQEYLDALRAAIRQNPIRRSSFI